MLISARFWFFTIGCLAGWMSLLAGCSAYLSSNASPIAGRYNLSPNSRTVRPTAILGVQGQVSSTAGGLLNGGSTVLQGQGSSIVLDFGREVGGIVSLQTGEASGGSQLAIAFSESSVYAGFASDQSNGGSGADGFLPVAVTPQSTYVVPAAKLRGGFRYLTIGLITNGPVQLTDVTLQFTAAPAMTNLRAYRGSFYSSDNELNRIWYAGAYTVQMDTIDPAQGRVWPPPDAGWFSNGISGSGSTILVDGAKRDRMIWPGDLGISALTDYLSLGDTDSVRNDLDALFAYQDPSGCFPYSGPEANLGPVSDTYHLWTLDAAIDYYFYTADRNWLLAHWGQIQSGIRFSTSKIDSNGLLSVTLLPDWGGQTPGGEEMGANALLYHVLQGAASVASQVGDAALETQYGAAASSLRAAIQSHFWNGAAGMYAEVPGSTLYPQDGNSLALWFGIPDAAEQMEIAANLRSRWNAYGAITPERPNAIATFPGSMEVMAHFAANDDSTAMDLIRLEWGYMLSSPLGTGSTFWEGYLQDGSFDYGGSYMSLAHGWATGPTAALTLFAAGVGPEMSSSVQFHFIPHPGDLSQVIATIPLAAGNVSVAWRHTNGVFIATVSAPNSMVGRYGIPIGSGASSILIDGKLAWSSCYPVAATQYGGSSSDGSRVYFGGIAGTHSVSESDRCSL
jgi:hypothetical protein